MAHIHQLIDFTIGAIIVHPSREKVLLVNHPRYNKWLYVGGHVELDEDPDQTLLREVKEEAGLEVEVIADRNDAVNELGLKSLWRPRFIDVHDANAPHKHIALSYICLAKSADAIKSDEHDDIRWFSVAELDELGDAVSKVIRYYAKVALEEVKHV